jgi:hypothetical protein
MGAGRILLNAEDYPIRGIGYDLLMRNAMLVLVVIGATGWAQKESPRQEFKDYAVEKVYTGTPAAPKLNKDQRTFRTMIRQGAKSKVEFAGHYTVPRWGCGAGCSMFVIVDSITGRVYDGMSVAEPSLDWIEKHTDYKRMDFQPTSRLMKINGCPGETNCGFYDYEMIEGKGLKLLRKELLPKEYQY